MKGDLCLPDKSQIAHEILAYLSDHPDAEDTLDGIVQWWILERKIRHQTTLVKEALSELINKDLITRHVTEDSTVYFHINKNKNGDW